MANHKSAEKRARQSESRRQRNKQYLSSVRTAVQAFRTALTTEGSAETASKLLVNAQTLLDKAAQKGMLHKNNASRKIGALANALDKYSKDQSSGKTAASATKKKATKKKATTKKKAAKKKTSKKK